MKFLFISSQALFRNTRFGGAKRLYYLARELEQLTELHVISLNGAQEWAQETPFPQEFKNQLFLPLVSLKSHWRRIFFLPVIRETLWRHRASIETFLEDQRFDATALAYPLSLCFLEQDWKERMGRIIYLEDDLLLENYRKDYLPKKPGLQKILKFFRYKRAFRYFKKCLEKVSVFVCISEQEEKVVHSWFPDLTTHILKYGIPLEDYPCLPEPDEKNILGFIGNYGHAPNLDALNWLITELFPFLVENEPAARLVLAGKNFPAHFKRFCTPSSGIQLLEDVENLEDFYGNIGIFVNPLREGRGLRTKVVEAAAFGRPILSTELGAEGLNELCLSLFVTKEQFLSGFRTLMKNPEYSEIARHNRNKIEIKFSLSKLGAELKRLLAPLKNNHSGDELIRDDEK